ncbi:TetR/AcrR family transcriptional regulator [Zooshikella marina]|uniref:TetR/AcrR family transcriptional regulator n=1 Tax=Zooshikella ganghwensis TaxID=202772 RepID=UPI001BB0A746|nr:TetR/AcrR family transcriptional regulator [Zooshikella ganghwensis]MBU2704768.1 TetR/AcrR family transcriptional regulator [Zooshikella ganghwensis]
MKEKLRNKRRDEILDIAVEVLAERGYRNASMLQVARQASASKETLYAWFNDKKGLFEEVIKRNAETVKTVLERHLESQSTVKNILNEFGCALLELLLSDNAVAINRAAISEVKADPSLAITLAKAGRDATLPVFIKLLNQLQSRGVLETMDSAQAAQDFLGLLIGDTQVRRLLDLEPAPSKAMIHARARHATDMFLRLYSS